MKSDLEKYLEDKVRKAFKNRHLTFFEKNKNLFTGTFTRGIISGIKSQYKLKVEFAIDDLKSLRKDRLYINGEFLK